jgi:hypothetical protein
MKRLADIVNHILRNFLTVAHETIIVPNNIYLIKKYNFNLVPPMIGSVSYKVNILFL